MVWSLRTSTWSPTGQWRRIRRLTSRRAAHGLACKPSAGGQPSAAMAPPSTTSRDELTSDCMCGPVALVTGEPKRVVGLEQPGEDQVESGRLAKLVDDLANDEAPVPLVAVA